MQSVSFGQHASREQYTVSINHLQKPRILFLVIDKTKFLRWQYMTMFIG